MARTHPIGVIVWAFAVSGALSGQVSGKVDFARDIQSLFKANCYSCHGLSQQMNGFRLDRRHGVIPNRVGANRALVVPGNSAGSRLYLKLIGTQYGLQMPPTGSLSPEQINLVKAWIDQGAEWPDDLSGDTPSSPPDPKATRIMVAIRNGDSQAFKAMLRENPKAAKLKGPGGSTPLMYAALYGDSESVRVLLKSGADPSVRNEAGATALMWSVDDSEKTRLLLDHGADANAFSDDGVTPLMIATGRFGSGAVVKILLDHGANPSAKSPDSSKIPLLEAARAGDEAVLRLLIEHGADVKSAPGAIAAAVASGCIGCMEIFVNSATRNALSSAMAVAVTKADVPVTRILLNHGADVNWTSPQFGVTTLMVAAASDIAPIELVKTLIDRGGDINAKTANAVTVLDLARRQGDTAVVDLLVTAGAKDGGWATKPALTAKAASSVRAAVERSIPLLQRADVTFIQKSGCVSCHNNSLTEMMTAIARAKGLPVDGEITRTQLRTIGAYIETWRERVLQGIGIPGNQDTISYILLGLAAEKYQPDAATDAFARFLKNRQSADGRWRISTNRSPLESSDFQNTAASIRTIQAFAPKPLRPEYDKSVQLGTAWLAKEQPKTTEDQAFQLLGLAWARANKEIMGTAAKRLIAGQRSDGGWAQIPSLSSDAYATGQALVALNECGALAVSDAAYKLGIQFLLTTQLEDGSWYVKSRALPFQPYFESDFPHGRDQWISAAATNWATMALALSVEVSKTPSTRAAR